MGFIPVGISLMREVVPPGDGDDRGRRDERDPRRRRRDRPAAVGLDRPDRRLARALLGGHRARRPGRPRLRASSCRTCTTATRARFDFGGAVGLAVGLIALLVGITKGNTWGWTLRPHPREHRARHRRPAGVGLVRAAPQRAAVRPPRHRAPPGAADQHRRRRDRLRDDGAGDRLPAAAAAAGGDRLGLDQTLLAAGLWMAPGGLMMLAFAPVASYLMRTFGAEVRPRARRRRPRLRLPALLLPDERARGRSWSRR